MKKLLFVLGLLGISSVSSASLPHYDQVCASNFCGGFTFGISGLYWCPTIPHYDYVLSYPDATDLENIKHRDVNNEYDWGVKANIGYIIPCSPTDIRLSYTYFNHNFTDHIAPLVDGLLVPTLTDTWPTVAIVPPFDFTVTLLSPGFALISSPTVSVISFATFDPEFASAKSSVEHNAADIELGQTINLGSKTRLRYFAGLRYAKVENTLDVNYEKNFLNTPVVFTGFAPFVFADIVSGEIIPEVAIIDITADVTGQLREAVNQKSNWQGFGPRSGLDVKYDFNCGFGVVGSLSTSLLVGEIDSALYELYNASLLEVVTSVSTLLPPEIAAADVGIVPGTVTGFSDISSISYKHPDKTRIVPNIDAKIGVNYTYTYRNCTQTKLIFEAGYMVSHYFNVLDRLSEVAANFPEGRSHQTIDVSFDGLYFGIQVKV